MCALNCHEGSMSHNYVNGAFVKGSSGETIQVFNPATEESIGAVPRGSALDAKSALEAASNAFPLWRKTSANVRAQMMHDAAAKMRTHKEAIVHLLTLEQGKPIPENEEEVEWLTNTFDYYAELGPTRARQGLTVGGIYATQPGYQRTLRRRAMHCALELSAPTDGLESCSGDCSGKYGNHQTERVDTFISVVFS